MAETLLSLTPAAVRRVRDLLASKGQGAAGLRLAVKPTGCSGFSYHLDFARAIGPEDRVVECEGVTVVVDPKAVPLVAGTRVDWVEDELGAQFVFRNPNEKARCGCGESFKV
ncbi:MAG: iron-sulfur cluster assembly accessory protein [Geminicoccaceae bacterium]|nr:iron-sulfur cluster assembly accessory protein [Geminicoccaceae bacterium]MCX8102098.1 iron-sulfur cluster assembly accessory protein [Geminicoccaceae bacterium]MDW8369714.1 iron-sulfur cluster assembly accessory protein [Geminicoccaceae bacterium]